MARLAVCWKLHLAVSVGCLWNPLAAQLTVANTADNEVAPLLLQEMPKQVRYVLGDTHYNARSFARPASEKRNEKIFFKNCIPFLFFGVYP
jgi:hypothetical protein